MAQVRGTFTEAYDNLDRDVYTLLGKEYKELKPIWRQYFTIKDSSKRSELATTVTGMGDVVERAEGGTFVTDIITVGFTKEFIHTGFGLAFEVTLDLVIFDKFADIILLINSQGG